MVDFFDQVDAWKQRWTADRDRLKAAAKMYGFSQKVRWNLGRWSVFGSGTQGLGGLVITGEDLDDVIAEMKNKQVAQGEEGP